MLFNLYFPTWIKIDDPVLEHVKEQRKHQFKVYLRISGNTPLQTKK